MAKDVKFNIKTKVDSNELKNKDGYDLFSQTKVVK